MVLAENWPQFRGPGGLGISQEKDLPVNWSEMENVAWKTAMPGYGSSSPIALDGKLYVTCYSGYGMAKKSGRMEDLVLHLVCVDSKTGKIIWDRLDGKRSLGDIVKELSAEFEASDREIGEDVLGFASELLKRGMLVDTASI